jgi:hypothetical protein
MCCGTAQRYGWNTPSLFEIGSGAYPLPPGIGGGLPSESPLPSRFQPEIWELGPKSAVYTAGVWSRYWLARNCSITLPSSSLTLARNAAASARIMLLSRAMANSS